MRRDCEGCRSGGALSAPCRGTIAVRCDGRPLDYSPRRVCRSRRCRRSANLSGGDRMVIGPLDNDSELAPAGRCTLLRCMSLLVAHSGRRSDFRFGVGSRDSNRDITAKHRLRPLWRHLSVRRASRAAKSRHFSSISLLKWVLHFPTQANNDKLRYVVMCLQ